MEEKEIQPSIQMKNSSVIIVKNSASIIFGLFFILLFFAKPFRKSKCPECKNVRRKIRARTIKGLPLWNAFYICSIILFILLPLKTTIFSSKVLYIFLICNMILI